jgi:hypothetical protein
MELSKREVRVLDKAIYRVATSSKFETVKFISIDKKDLIVLHRSEPVLSNDNYVSEDMVIAHSYNYISSNNKNLYKAI